MLFLLHYVFLAVRLGVIWFFSLGLILLWIFHIGAISYGLYKFHWKKKQPNNLKDLPGVSIIKPLTCIDPNLYENLKTFFHMKYPRYEILFCIQEYDSELIDMIKKLQGQYSNVSTCLFVDLKQWLHFGNKTESLVNPKIINMLPAYDSAQYPFILISDSGIMMHEDTLYDMVALMTDNVGLVHQLPFTCDRNSFSGTIEKIHFGTQHARVYMAINLLGVNCVTGMSCLIRKECIDRAGGLRAVGSYIAEDYQLANAVSKQGWKLTIATSPAQQNSGDFSLKMWTERLIRWSKLRMCLGVSAYLEPFQECFSSALLCGLITNHFFEWNITIAAACHALIWFILDYVLLRVTQRGPIPFSKFEFTVAWLIREILSYYVYFKAFTTPSIIRWRGKDYRLRCGTRAEPIFRSHTKSSQSTKPTTVGFTTDFTSPVTNQHSSSLTTLIK